MTALWIAWEDDTSIRSRVLAEELGARYRALTAFDHSRYFHWLRYPTAALMTLWLLLRHRPTLLVVQNPSILLAFEAALLRPLFGYRLAIDLHTPFLRAGGFTKTVTDFVHEYGLRHSDAVIVTNDALRQRVAQQTRSPVFILPDRIPRLQGTVDRTVSRGGRAVLYVCTYSEDEPWREVLAAAALLPEDVTVYISGRSRLDRAALPKNVIPTGYLPLEEYHTILRSVDAVMVLTTVEENLVCGGYEAVAAGKPLVLSDTAALRDYFRTGTVFTRNRAADIAAAIRRALDQGDALRPQIGALRLDLDRQWDEQWRALVGALQYSLPTPSTSASGGANEPTGRRLRVGG